MNSWVKSLGVTSTVVLLTVAWLSVLVYYPTVSLSIMAGFMIVCLFAVIKIIFDNGKYGNKYED